MKTLYGELQSQVADVFADFGRTTRTFRKQEWHLCKRLPKGALWSKVADNRENHKHIPETGNDTFAKDCQKGHWSLSTTAYQSVSKYAHVAVTLMAIFERLYLVPGLGSFGSRVNCPYSPTPPPLTYRIFLDSCTSGPSFFWSARSIAISLV